MRPLFTLLMLFSLHFRAQDFSPFHYNYSTDNNFPSNTVYSLLQSNDGAIYIGHDEGLSRFNGRNFFHYNYKGKGKALNNLVETIDQKVLATSFYGDLAAFKNDKLSTHPYSHEEKTGRPILVKCGDRIFVHERDKFFEYVNDTLKPLIIEKDSKDIWILDVCEDDRGRFLVLYNSQGLKVKTFDKDFKEISRTDCDDEFQNRFRFLKIGESIFIYSFDQNQLFEFDNGKIEKSQIKLSYDHTYTKWLHAERFDGFTIIIYGFDGILFLNNNGRVVRHLLKGSQVSSVIKDKEGNIWAGTLNEGVFVFPSLDIFNASLVNILGKDDYAHRAVAVSANKMVIGTFKGKLICTDAESKIEKCLSFKKQSEVQSLTYDSVNRKIYAYCDGLFKVDEKTFKVEKEWNITSTKDIKICGDKIICATSNNLITITGDEINSRFQGTWINTVYCESNNALWYGGNKGLFYYDSEKDIAKRFEVPAGDLKSQMVWRIRAWKGEMYVLIPGYGILEKKENNTFKPLVQNELIRDFKISEGKIYALLKNEIRIYDLVPGTELYRLNETKAMENNIIDFLISDGKLVVIHPKSIKVFKSLISKNLSRPQIKLSALKGSFELSEMNTYLSEYRNNTIEFALEILGDIRGKKLSSIKHRFFKEGESQEWSVLNSDADFSFKFQQLAAGNYIFEAIAINEDGAESDPFLLKLQVLSPFWMKWWFFLIEAVIVIVLLALLYKWRINAVEKKAREANERQLKEIKLLSAELTAIRSQMNPHFIFNTLSSIQAKVLSAKAEDAFDDIARFSQLIRSVLDYSSKEFIPLANEIEFIKNYLHLESGRFGGEILYSLHVDDEIDVKFVEIPTLITIPFIENSFRHGLMHKDGEKMLTISIGGNNEELTISICDNGIGLKGSREINNRSRKDHKSFALSSTKSRIERINQSGKAKINLSINELKQGVEVIINIQY